MEEEEEEERTEGRRRQTHLMEGEKEHARKAKEEQTEGRGMKRRRGGQ